MQFPSSQEESVDERYVDEPDRSLPLDAGISAMGDHLWLIQKDCPVQV